MKYYSKRLIIWRSLVQAQAGPQTKRLIPKGIEPLLVCKPTRYKSVAWVILALI